MRLNRDQVEKWGMLEITLHSGQIFGNPFTESELTARFQNGYHAVEVTGFHDGGDTWKIRFMPEHTGRYTFRLRSNIAGLHGLTGEFTCTSPSPGNHGPVHVYRQYHFAYDDGTPFYVHGTTAYAWTTSSEAVRKKTVESVAEHGFNKLRMGFFPKRLEGQVMIDTTQDPPTLPYEGEAGSLDLKRFRVDYFRRFEEDLLFVRYIAARLSAYRNVWWCLCNEYDLLLTPTSERTHTVECVSTQKNWDAIGKQLRWADPYNHPRSIHNFTTGFIPDFEWMSHVAFQNSQTYEVVLETKRRYGKPSIADEFGYEGNITGSTWGDRTPEHEMECFIRAVMAGGYAPHGESYIVDGNIRDIFWAYGGAMVGQSAPRLKLFRSIMESCPFTEMEPEIAMTQGSGGLCLRKGVEVLLIFFRRPPESGDFALLTTDLRAEYDMTLYDLWNGTTTDGGTVKRGRVALDIPAWTMIKLTARAGTKD